MRKFFEWLEREFGRQATLEFKFNVDIEKFKGTEDICSLLKGKTNGFYDWEKIGRNWSLELSQLNYGLFLPWLEKNYGTVAYTKFIEDTEPTDGIYVSIDIMAVDTYTDRFWSEVLTHWNNSEERMK